MTVIELGDQCIDGDIGVHFAHVYSLRTQLRLTRGPVDAGAVQGVLPDRGDGDIQDRAGRCGIDDRLDGQAQLADIQRSIASQHHTDEHLLRFHRHLQRNGAACTRRTDDRIGL
ncbi:hypothetical protein [Xanthomonas arboricola]|uniref:hypothetical protein n=1 Tax=Xanthomonas arboricola TaxID=56448 RepID=UPI001FD07C53|nr:hypothetical protein [Xanthomonas arboricola]